MPKARLIISHREVKVFEKASKDAGLEVVSMDRIRDDVYAEVKFKTPLELFKAGQYVAYTVAEQDHKK